MKEWFKCPKCNQKILKFDRKLGKSKKVFIKCKKCKEEIEIKI